MYFERRINESFSVLLDELRAGEIGELDVANQDEVVAICHRFLIAARDGTARRNMRLLARALVGLAKQDRLYSDEFNKYADTLARLTRDQILLLGRYHAMWVEEIEQSTDQEEARARAWKRLNNQLVPTEFPTADHIISICAQAAGLGLLNMGSAFGGLIYRPSPILLEIIDLADFQDVLRAEGEFPNSR